MLTAFVAPFLVLGACAPDARPLIAEILYDAAGDDTGFEFVELFNPSPVPHPLAGARLEAGDGAGPGRWTLRWTGGADDTIPAGGRFVIGGTHVSPGADAVVELGLQNGPDAVRMVWPDGATEVVGYGALALPEYACGDPAPDVPSGFSLAREPDASDLGSNARDFVAATPSPGAANRPARDAALIAGTLALVPEQPEPGAPALLSGLVVNRGAETIAERETALSAEDAGATLATLQLEGAIAPGDTVPYALPLPGLTAGARVLRVIVRVPGDLSASGDADSLRIRVGLGPLEITEIQFHPAQGEGEWVEVRNRSRAPLALAGFTLADRRGAPGTPRYGNDPLAAESLAIFAQDRIAFMARFPALDSTRVWHVAPWASLNNSDDSSGVADVVTLREADGTPCERAPYSARGIASGVPIERRPGGEWAPAVDPLGGPLLPPRAPTPIAARFAVTPRRLAAHGAATIGWDLPWPRGRVVVDLYDLAGRRVSRVLPEASVSGRGERPWNPEGVRPGVYVLALLARAEGGPGTLSASQVVRVEGSVP